VVIQIAHCRSGSVSVCELCEAKAFWSSSLLVVDKAKTENLTNAAQRLDNLLLGDAYCINISVKVAWSVGGAVRTVRNISDKDHTACLVVRRHLGV
jgi:hypothetical protein